jgi:hypothetical protein
MRCPPKIWDAYMEWLSANQRKNTAFWLKTGKNDPMLPVSVSQTSWELFALNNPVCGML